MSSTDKRVIRPARDGRARAVVAAAGALLALAPSAQAHAASAVRAFTSLEFPVYNQSFHWPALFPTPLQAWGRVTSAGPQSGIGFVDQLQLLADIAEDGGLLAAFTSDASSAGAPPPGDRQHEFVGQVIWSKTFVKTAGDVATYTIDHYDLDLSSPSLNSGAPDHDPPYPFASASITLSLFRHDLAAGGAGAGQVVLVSNVSLQPLEPGTDRQICWPVPLALGPPLAWCLSGSEQGHSATLERASPILSFLDQGSNSAFVGSERHRGTIDLTGIPNGALFTISYWLDARAGVFGGDSSASADIGTPSNGQQGIQINTTSVPFGGGKPPRVSPAVPDPRRYADGGDGTVADNDTGLIWLRCPLGQTLDDAGTPAALDDDRCMATAGAADALDWQQALDNARGASIGGHDDWRLPTIAELESIVELDCLLPAIEPGPFPDTPLDPFWSSTPGRAAGTAMAVEAATGDIHALPATVRARVRLVRGQPLARPTPSRPELRIGVPAPVTEGDSGTTTVTFPVTLDRPAAADVTVQYATADGTATAGQDYVAAAGTLVIRAGAQSGAVTVPVLGDTVPEAVETFYLTLSQASANARLVVASRAADIIDDERRVEVRDNDAYEGDAGEADLAFAVTLSAPSDADTAVAYQTSDDTATAGDYVPASGTVTIPAGQTMALVHVRVKGDTAREADESFTLTLTGVSGNARIGQQGAASGWIVDDDGGPTLRALNDTGISLCTSGVIFDTCPGDGYPGQDGDVGRDVTQPDAGDGWLGFSFVKLDAAGQPLADQTVSYAASPWPCVRDQVTGLTWEVKPSDGGVRDRHWTYTWYDPTGLDDGGDPGTAGGGSCGSGGAPACDTAGYAAAVNAAALCGAHDWRLPSRDELATLTTNRGGGLNSLGDPAYFQSTSDIGGYWTATPGFDGASAWSFASDTVALYDKSTPRLVRLVRAEAR